MSLAPSKSPNASTQIRNGTTAGDAPSLKEAGNKAFAAGDLEQAFLSYSNALKKCDQLSAPGATDLRATVLTNRAAVLLKQGKAAACVEDCTSALDLDPGRVKAYFRRALAREQLGDNANALRDARRVIELDKSNKDAVKAARRIKDKVARAAEEESPIRQALKALSEAASKFELGEKTAAQGQTGNDTEVTNAASGAGAGAGDAVPTGPSAASKPDDTEHSQALLVLGSLMGRDASAALQLLRGEGMKELRVCMAAGAEYPKSVKEALRALGASAQHKAFGLALLKTSEGTEALHDIAQVLEDPRQTGAAEGALSAAVHLLRWDQGAVVEGLSQERDVERGQVENAGRELATAAVRILTAGLDKTEREVFDLALEAVVRWCASLPEENTDSSKPTFEGLTAKEAYEERQKLHRGRLRASLWLRDKGFLLFSSPSLLSLYKHLSSDDAVERRKASACLSRVCKAVTDVQANEKERQVDSDAMKKVLQPLLQFQGPDTEGSSGASQFGEAKATGDVIRLLETESRMQGCIRRVSLATALATADSGLGSWAMHLQGFLGEAMTLAATGDPIGQEAAGEAFCCAASFDGGRTLLGPVIESGIMFALMESKSQAARSAAASAYAKLGMISSALSSDSDDVTKLLNVSLDLIAPASGDSTAGTKGQVGRLSTSAGINEMSKAAGAAGDGERAVEVLSFLVSKTKVKEELCYGSSRCPKALSRLTHAAQNIKGASPISYGLAFIFSSLCVSKEDATKESFKGKDTTYEQYEQLKQLHEAHGQGPKEDTTDMKDSSEAARRRSHALTEAGCVLALKKLAEGANGANGASPATMEQVARCFRRLATEPLNRGHIIQQGGLALLISMASPSQGEKDGGGKGKGKNTVQAKDEQGQGKGCREESRHGIAKTLVTTNPNLLTEAQTMGCVPPLIAMCRDHEALNLQQFEGLLALTNLASIESVKGRIIAEKGISCFQFLQFSDHELVRRASTEALCNLMPHPKMMEHLKRGDTLKLFAAFAQLGPEDPPTAVAAMGCIAMAVADKEVAEGFMADGVGGCEALVFALLSTAPDVPNAAAALDLVLRAAVATSYIAEHKTLRSQLLKGGVVDALREAVEVTQEDDGVGAARAVEACTRALALLEES